MFRIGEFSKLGQVSSRMLRHYDKLGLLKPSATDEWTGYRYYTIEQLPRLHRIIALKDLGLSLEQIGILLDAHQDGLVKVAIGRASDFYGPRVTDSVVGEMLYEFEEPYLVDDSQFRQVFGASPTPHQQTIKETIAWYREASG